LASRSIRAKASAGQVIVFIRLPFRLGLCVALHSKRGKPGFQTGQQFDAGHANSAGYHKKSIQAGQMRLRFQKRYE